ncbi:helix-turn-helix domain-containing protein [Nocardioides sp.]|uniref:helix-turn-helix domain-containing protein n=1 Tax=Nocardioides sp. TaxID=35761 RepID=UPI002B268A68|nr:tetratricopeptide repeat protein [Nocardioides sp.]
MSSHEDLADLRVKVKTIDAGLLGRRIRHARQRAGLTQGDAAGTDMSTAYISRIEAGQRRPGADLLIALAERLTCTPEELLAPDDSVITFDAAVVARLTLELDYADLELRTGSPELTLGRVEAVLAESEKTTAVPPELRHQARLLQALAREAVGPRADAIDLFERIVAHDADVMRLLKAYTALSRCYRDSTDYARAADIGERAVAALGQEQLDSSAEGLQLTVTVASAHFERGDVNHAVRVCQRALEQAENLDSPEARAAAYWNTSIMESRQGRVEAALPMAEKALSLLEVAEDSRSQTRLRIQLGVLHLQCDPPLPLEALEILNRAEADGRVSGINEADRARIQMGQARAQFLLGALFEASEILDSILGCVETESSILGVEALLLQGEIAGVHGRSEDAIAHLRAASEQLAEYDGDHGVAQLWFELGACLDEHGLYREAAQAYKSAGATTGLSRPTAAAAPRVASV